MSDVNTGTNPCPATFLVVRKSTTADATTRRWLIVADARTFYMWALTGDTADVYLRWMFGDFYSFKPNDPYRVMIQGRISEDNGVTFGAQEGSDTTGAASAGDSFHRIFRDTAENVGSIAAAQQGGAAFAADTALAGILAYKNPADQYAHTPPLLVVHPANGVTRRGLLRGMYHFCHPITNVTDRETMPGREDLAGKTLMVVKKGGNGGVWLVETSSTWASNA